MQSFHLSRNEHCKNLEYSFKTFSATWPHLVITWQVKPVLRLLNEASCQTAVQLWIFVTIPATVIPVPICFSTTNFNMTCHHPIPTSSISQLSLLTTVLIPMFTLKLILLLQYYHRYCGSTTIRIPRRFLPTALVSWWHYVGLPQSLVISLLIGWFLF